jgi:hypothetical protein
LRKSTKHANNFSFLWRYLSIRVLRTNIWSEVRESLVNPILLLYPMPKTSLHIFDHTVKPILLYCSEIWGCYLPKSADFNFMFDYSRL